MNLQEISKKRQKKRKDTNLYKVVEDSSKPKFYILDMFPYPSGAGLHVGHPKGYIATDTLARKKMLEGYNVLHPMGFDTFGLGTENYAIEHKMKPQDVAKQNIENYMRQLEMFGTTYDRSRAVNTADPKYFKRTQRVFLQMYNHYYDEQEKKALPIQNLKSKIQNGTIKIDEDIDIYLNKQRLAYVDYKPINRCPKCMTGLANEDLDDGKCERCGSVVEQRPMKQRVLRITKYAERLLEGLDTLKREESMKELERNWIGKSEGTEFKMKIVIPENDTENIREGNTENVGEGLTKKKLSKENNDGTYDIIGIAMKVHKELGPGLQEKIYQKGLQKLLKDAGYKVEVEKKVQYKIDGETIGYGAIDLLVNDTIAIELKSRKILEGDFYKQLRTYINQSEKITCGLLINFYNGKLDYKRLEKDYDIKEGKKILSNSQVAFQKSSDILGHSQNDSLEFRVYTTRIDTVFGMSFVAIAPEHPLLEKILNSEFGILNGNEIRDYQEQTKHKTQLERTELQKEKTGVRIEGLYAINPFNNEKVKIFVADYVLANYGTGVVMAVPAHDERDFEFAKKYDLPIMQVIIKGPHPEPFSSNEKEGLPHSKNKKEFSLYQRIDKDIVQFTKELRKKQTPAEEIFWELVRNNKLGYKFRRQHPFGRYIVDFYCHECKLVVEIDGGIHDKEENKKNDKLREKDLKMEGLHIMRFNNDDILNNPDKVIQTVLEFISSHLPVGEGAGGEGKLTQAYTEKGILMNSGEFSGLQSDEAITKMQAWLEKKGIGGVKVNYKMQDRVFSRQRYRGEPFPVLRTNEGGMMNDEGGMKIIPLDEKDLPLELPDVDNYEPTGTEEGPLANITDRVNVTLKDGKKAKRETNTMPGRAGSSRYRLRYMDVNNDKALVGKDKEKYRGNVDVYVGGAEHVTRHMIYARFRQKFLYDIGIVTKQEPFEEYHYVGLIMGEDGRKMSKRRGNVVNPDTIINEFGTDALRTYEMFMGPFDQPIAWSTNGIKGVKKFLEKIIALKDKITAGSLKLEAGSPGSADGNTNKETLTIVNQTIKKVGEDIDAFRFNTGVSQLMILVNHLTDCKNISRKTFEDLVVLVSPFAPHLAEELWEQLGNEYSVFTKAKRPKYDEKYLVADTVTIAVQVNGKVRGTINISKDAEEKEVIKLAKIDEKIKTRITSEPKKVIYVKGKILNIVM